MRTPKSVSLLNVLKPLPPFSQFLCILYVALRVSFFAYYMLPPSDRFFSYHMGAPLRSVFFLLIIWRPPHISFFVYFMRVFMRVFMSFFTYYMRTTSDHILHIPCRAPSDQFFCKPLRGPLRTVSSPTILGPPQNILFAYYIPLPPLISFFAYYNGSPSDHFLCIRAPQINYFVYNIGAPPHVSFLAYYIGASRTVFLFTILVPPLPVSSRTNVSFFNL